ncbi:MAG: DUF1566 domain-containing protein [Treponema sp.]|nr:DUF1566 domain-containing protein [Treponema sp.]
MHTYSLWQETNAPICTEAGEETEKCSKCNELGTKKQVGTDALGHQGLTLAFAATCTTSGNSEESGTCTRAGCGEVVTGTVINALGHQGFNAVNATCTENGNTGSGICTRTSCGEVVTETVINALGHEILNWSTYNTTTGHVSCSRSGCTGGFAKIGDTGPAGGIIFYVALTGFTITDDSSIAYYLEAALTNAIGGETGVQTTMRWSIIASSPYPDVAGTGFGIGSGRNNTALIIAAQEATYPSDTYIYAALACKNYFVTSFDSFDDWFLPSKDELNQLYLRRADVGITSGRFWSSSCDPIAAAYDHDFDIGLHGGFYQGHNQNVRAVRAF